eukprot:439492-Amphidinium_carterae.1
MGSSLIASGAITRWRCAGRERHAADSSGRGERAKVMPHNWRRSPRAHRLIQRSGMGGGCI